MKQIPTRKPQRLPTFIRPDAHAALPQLCEMLSQEKGVGVSYTDAITIAIREAVQRRKQERNRERQTA